MAARGQAAPRPRLWILSTFSARWIVWFNPLRGLWDMRVGCPWASCASLAVMDVEHFQCLLDCLVQPLRGWWNMRVGCPWASCASPPVMDIERFQCSLDCSVQPLRGWWDMRVGSPWACCVSPPFMDVWHFQCPVYTPMPRSGRISITVGAAQQTRGNKGV